MAHENATPRPWRTTKTQPNVICNEGGNHWIARATIGKGSPRFIQDAGIAAANAALIVEAVNAYDTLRAENERLRSALAGVIEWDKRRGYIVPYAVRDPLYAALSEAQP